MVFLIIDVSSIDIEDKIDPKTFRKTFANKNMYHINKSFRRIFMSFIGSLALATTVAAGNALAAVNLVANPSLETANSTGAAPLNWTGVKNGTNNAVFSWPAIGAQAGTRLGKIVISSFTNGDAKWVFDAVAVTAGKTYYFTDYYKATVSTKTYAEFQDPAGVKTVQLLGTNASKIAWTKAAYTFTAPANAVKVTIYQVLALRGTLQIDNYSLIQVPDPTITSNVPNASLEEINPSNSLPLGWVNEKTGTNSVTFSYLATGHTGSHSIRTRINSFTSGTVRWYFTPQAIAGGQCYTFSDWYKSNIVSQVSVQAINAGGTATAINLANAPASSTAWKQYSASVCLPADTVKYTVYHTINKVGNLTLDDLSLVQQTPKGTIIVKKVTSGGDSTFNFTTTGMDYQGFTLANGQQNSQVLAAGNYSVAETALADWTSDGGACNNGQTPANIVLTANQTVTCTFTNAYVPPTATLTVKKILSPASDFGRFDLLVNGQAKATSVGNDGTTGAMVLAAGTHTVSELAATGTSLENYTAVIGGDCAANGTITLAAGDNKTCTITNTYTPPTAKLRIEMTTANSGKFDILLDGATQSTNITNGNVSTTISIGTHVVSINAASGTNSADYTTTFSSDCNATGAITLAKDDNKTCTITNSYAPGSTANLVLNPSVEEFDATTTLPLHWATGGWGTNTPIYTYDTTGNTGARSLKVELTSYTDGDAKWYFDPIPVTPGQRYLVTDYYMSNVATQVSVEFNLSNGTQAYPEIGFPVAASDWTKFSTVVTAPANAVSMTVLHFINKTGWLATDDYSVTEAPTPTGNPANASLEITSPADPENLPDLWNKSKWGTNTVAFTYLQNEGHAGTKSVKIDMTARTDGDAKWYFDPIPVTPGDSYMVSDWYKATIPTHVVVAFTNTDNTLKYAELRMAPAAADWTQFSEIVQVPMNAKTMTVYHMISAVGSLTTDDYSVAKTTPIGFNRPIVSITFDDSWETNTSTAVPAMATYGFKATHYLATTYLMDPLNTDDTGRDGPTAVNYIRGLGNEIGSHSITHPWLTQVDSTTLNNELSQSKSYLESIVGAGNIKGFATPYGDYNETVLNAIKANYASHRTVDEGYNLKNNFDVSRIKVQNMKKTTTMAEYQSWVNQAVKDNSWLVILYHRVLTPTTADPLEDFDTPLADFAPQMNAIQASGATVLPISDAIAELAPQI